MSIPRFNAQIGKIQVPSMQNYQEKQNESISRSLADFGGKILSGSMKLLFASGKDSNLFDLTEEVDKASSADRS